MLKHRVNGLHILVAIPKCYPTKFSMGNKLRCETMIQMLNAKLLEDLRHSFSIRDDLDNKSNSSIVLMPRNYKGKQTFQCKINQPTCYDELIIHMPLWNLFVQGFVCNPKCKAVLQC